MEKRKCPLEKEIKEAVHRTLGFFFNALLVREGTTVPGHGPCIPFLIAHMLLSSSHSIFYIMIH